MREPALIKTIVGYALVFVVAAFALQWLEYRFVLRQLPGAWALGLVALLFVVLGGWVGLALARPERGATFERNDRALDSLGISKREFTVLELLAYGQTNKEIARTLGISPNTVKTHVANLYDKLGTSRRTEAINKSRELRLIP